MISARASYLEFQSPTADLNPCPELQGHRSEPLTVRDYDGSETCHGGSVSFDPGQEPGPLPGNYQGSLGRRSKACSVENPFFRQAPVAPLFEVPPLPVFLEELKHCWADPRWFSHAGRVARTLASMRIPGTPGLNHMLPVITA